MPPQKRPYRHRTSNLRADETRLRKAAIKFAPGSAKGEAFLLEKRLVGNYRIAVNASLHEIGVTHKANKKLYDRVINLARKLGKFDYDSFRLRSIPSPDAMQMLALSSIVPRRQFVRRRIRELLSEEVGFASAQRFQAALGLNLYATEQERINLIKNV